MELTVKQQEGLNIALQRWRDGEKYTVIAGYAGTGKSTLVKFIIDAMQIDPEHVRYVAYTGKAANVLKNKGCPGATTAHKLLYHTKKTANGFIFIPKSMQEMCEEEIYVVVIDEVSMLPEEMWNLMCKYNFYIIACGDPEQLPPVRNKDGDETNNCILDHPHIFLTDIMRQAQESEIIRLSMHIRENKPIRDFNFAEEQAMLVSQSDISDSMLLWADQVLCATNNTKNKLNTQIRNALGFTSKPTINDKIINLHNEWEIFSNKDNPLTNGNIGKIIALSFEQMRLPSWFNKSSIPVISADISGDEEHEVYFSLKFDYNELITGTPSLTSKEEFKLERMHIPVPLHGNFGYAITTWKAQGSEWNKVLLYTESWPYEPVLKKRFLYTAITRASDKIVIIA